MRNVLVQMKKHAGLNDWNLTKKLGAGAFASVYQARRITGNFPDVAIKIIKKAKLTTYEVRQA